MKPSRWLILSESSCGTIAYSSFTGALAKVNAEFFAVLDALKAGQTVDRTSHLVSEMRRCGFIVDDDTDELALYESAIQSQKQKRVSLSLVIAPTLACNFRCPYCFEEHRNITMTPQVQSAITDYVRKKLAAGEVQTFSVMWYGGEPLLEPGIIASLSEEFMKICAAEGVRYSASIITNGYLVDKSAAEMLKRCDVSFAQVTIDGTPEVHNRRRVLAGAEESGTFGRIVEGVNFLQDAEIQVTVRMNVDCTNADGTEECIAALMGAVRDKSSLLFSPGHVMSCEGEYSGCLTKQEYGAVLLECMKNCAAHGLPFSRKFSLPKLRTSYCMATQSGSFVIDPEGLVYKCWNDIGIKDYSIGDISGLIGDDLREEFACSGWGRYSQVNYESCRECKILPVCAGGCPRGAVHFGREPDCEACKYILDALLEAQCMNVKGGAKHGDSNRTLTVSA